MIPKFHKGDVVRTKYELHKYTIIRRVPTDVEGDERILYLCQSHIYKSSQPLLDEAEIEDEFPRPFIIQLGWKNVVTVARSNKRRNEHVYNITPSSRARIERFINTAPIKIVWKTGTAPSFQYKWREIG